MLPARCSPEFDVVVDTAGVRWFGVMQLSPPLVSGRLTDDRGRTVPLSGTVCGRRSLRDLGAIIDKDLRRSLVPPLLSGFFDLYSGWILGEWAKIDLRFGGMQAGLAFVTHQTSRRVVAGVPIVQPDPSLARWLKDFLPAAERRLGAFSGAVPSPGVAWERAGLHLVFRELDNAVAVARAGVELVGSMSRSGSAHGPQLAPQHGPHHGPPVGAGLRADRGADLRGDDVSAGLALADVFDHVGRREAAAQLRAVLEA